MKNLRLAKLSFPIVTLDSDGIWQKWKAGKISDAEFVVRMQQVRKAKFPGIKNKIIQDGIKNLLDTFETLKDYKETAHELNTLLSEDAILDFGDSGYDRSDV